SVLRPVIDALHRRPRSIARRCSAAAFPRATGEKPDMSRRREETRKTPLSLRHHRHSIRRASLAWRAGNGSPLHLPRTTWPPALETLGGASGVRTFGHRIGIRHTFGRPPRRVS